MSAKHGSTSEYIVEYDKQWRQFTSYCYVLNKLFDYIDSLRDLGALLYNANIKAYEPKGKEWIKE